MITGLLPSLHPDKTDANSSYYLILDTIVRARRIAHIIHPAHLENTFRSADFENAARARSDVFKRGEVYILSQHWNEPRVIAVGFSILGITKLGSRMSKIGVTGAAAEVFMTLSKKMPSILFKEL